MLINDELSSSTSKGFISPSNVVFKTRRDAIQNFKVLESAKGCDEFGEKLPFYIEWTLLWGHRISGKTLAFLAAMSATACVGVGQWHLHLTFHVKKSCSVLHISWKLCKFLTLLILQAKNHARFLYQLSCKIKILHISCIIFLCIFCIIILQNESLASFFASRYLTRLKACTFLAPAIFQDDNLASFLHQISYKMKILQLLASDYMYVNESLASIF